MTTSQDDRTVMLGWQEINENNGTYYSCLGKEQEIMTHHWMVGSIMFWQYVFGCQRLSTNFWMLINWEFPSLWGFSHPICLWFLDMLNVWPRGVPVQKLAADNPWTLLQAYFLRGNSTALQDPHRFLEIKTMDLRRRSHQNAWIL